MKKLIQKRLNTAVLLVIFNRPETTLKVFEAIREAQPPRLYVAADGPRQSVTSDIGKCEAARQVATMVDWDCELRTLFRDYNLNCGLGPSSAFTWFFRNENEGIILEDDCLPSQSFFWFCEALLEKYRDDDRVFHIGGNNFLEGWRKDHDYDYYFSNNGHIWGWATWKRAWECFDYEISKYEQLREKGYFDHFFLNALEKYYRLQKFEKTASNRGEIDWWDYQWDFARYINNGLAIVPQINLVKNIGFGEEATHTTNTQSSSATMQAEELDLPLVHPPFLIRDYESDIRYFKKFMINNIKSKIKRLVPVADY